MKRDDALLLDILLAARDARAFVEGMSWKAFSVSRLHQNAVIRSLEIIGEASGKLSPDVREQHPEVPWSDIVGMRHRLIHDYGETRLDVVWDVVRIHLPALIGTVELLVPPPPPASETRSEPLEDRADRGISPSGAEATPAGKRQKRRPYSPK